MVAREQDPATAEVFSPRRAALWLVMGAAVYDALVCIAIFFVVSALAVVANRGQAIPPGTIIYDVALLVAPLPYFTWCWTRGGQTLGMRAWRVRLARMDGEAVSMRDCLVRYLGALLSWAACGLGFIWIGVGPRHASWHDLLSGTRVYRVS